MTKSQRPPIQYIPSETNQAPGEDALYVPVVFRGVPVDRMTISQLNRQGIVFRKVESAAKGVVSDNRAMVIVFCDLKGSTSALRSLGAAKFRDIQTRFFEHCSEAIGDLSADATSSPEEVQPNGAQTATSNEGHTADQEQEGMQGIHYPRIVIDKFMGDCVMAYVDCDDVTPTWQEDGKCREAVRMVLTLVDRVIGGLEDINSEQDYKSRGIRLGARFGIALGDSITLSVLGGVAPWDTGGRFMHPLDFTVTGEIVNLAARLEHATEAEFMAGIEQRGRELKDYAAKLRNEEHLHGTRLDRELRQVDRQIVDAYDVCHSLFQIRANDAFREQADRLAQEQRDGEGFRQLRWQAIPFSPRGFSGSQTANLLGGDSRLELFRVT